MSTRRWTADIHYGHANISKFCKRPTLRKTDLDENGNWVSHEVAIEAANRMDAFLTKQMNARIKDDDETIHVGDFINYGSNKGDPGLRNKPSDYLKQLKGTWIFIEGNHDGNNNVRSIGRHLITSIAKLRVFVSHYPTTSEAQDPELMAWVRKNCAFAICGHVHEKWAEMWDEDLLNINVGVEVRKYLPISDSEVFNVYEKAKRERFGK